MAYFPFFIEIEEKNWLLAGAGSVALRKARALLSCQARVTVVAPKIDEGFFLLRQENGENLLLLPRGFQDSDLEKMDFVIAATADRRINERIAKQCRERNIPVNVADQREECSFLFPSLIQRGPVTVGISTGGNSPLLSHLIREQVNSILPEQLGEIVQQLGTLRDGVKSRFPQEPDCRRRVFDILARTALAKGRPLTTQEIQTALDHIETDGLLSAR